MLHVLRLVLVTSLVILPAARGAEPGRPPAYGGFLDELRAADAVVTLKVLGAVSSDERDPVTNGVVSVTVRGEVVEVFKGGLKVGQVVEVFVPYAELDLARRPGADVAHLYFGYVPLVGEPGTFLLAAGEPRRATNLLNSLVGAKYNRAYVKASEARGAEAALRLAELFCEVSLALLRDEGPVYGYSRTLCEDVKRHWRELDPAAEPFRRRIVGRYGPAVLEQCAKATLLTITVGWDAVVWVYSCLDDSGGREAVRRLVSAHTASVERVRKLPPRRPAQPRDPKQRVGAGGSAGAGAPAPDPRDLEATLQSFLLGAMQLVMEPGWREGPPGKMLGHLIPYEQVLGDGSKAEAVLRAARAFAGGE